MSTKNDEKSADDASPKIGSKPSSPTFSEKSVTFPAEKSTSSGSSVKKVVSDKSKKEKPVAVDRVKSQVSIEKNRPEKVHEANKPQTSKQGQAIGKSNQSQSQDDAIPAERKVSRYSERRNKIKEKQSSKLENTDVAIESVQVTDQSQQSNIKSDEPINPDMQ